ncbi:MAG: hypothetical protein QM747_03030 [Nocardioides sp.]
MSPEAAPTPDYVHRTGAPPGFKTIHLVIGVVIFVVWFGVLGFVLTHGRNEDSSVDVYSELPPGFTASLAAKGLTYQGLSSVDPTTQEDALARVPASDTGTEQNGGKPLVFRTAYTQAKGSGQPGVARSALMIVVPGPGGAGFHVDFVDPTSFQQLASADISGTGSSTAP